MSYFQTIKINNVLKIIVRNFSLKLKRPYSNNKTLKECLEKYGIIPDILFQAPEKVLEVKYFDDIYPVDLGRTKFSSKQTEKPPISVKWGGDNKKFYTLYMGDLDAPSQKFPTEREWQHWIVGNIPGENVPKGDQLVPYIGPWPLEDTGLHRYVFLVYEQTKYMEFKVPCEWKKPKGRGKFNIGKFVKQHCMRDPLAVNFFFGDYDTYVDTVVANFKRKIF